MVYFIPFHYSILIVVRIQVVVCCCSNTSENLVDSIKKSFFNCYDQNIYIKKSSRHNCRIRAYPAGPKKAAAGNGHIRQVLQPGSISNRATTKISICRFSRTAPHFSLKFSKRTNPRLKNICATSVNYT